MNLTFEYKIEPTNEQVLLMDKWLEVCRRVYVRRESCAV